MRFDRVFLAGVIATIVAGCSSATENRPTALTGVWQSERFALQPTGSYQITLTFDANGQATTEARDFGLYPGDRPDDVSSYSRTIGTYELTADSLRVHPMKIVWLDHFEGPDAKEHTMDLAPNVAVEESSRWTLNDDRLVLNYLSYPADAPVATTATYHRVR